MKPKLLLCFALVLSGGLFGCATKYRLHSSNWHPPPYDWPVFYDCEKGPTQLHISREPQTMDFYMNEIPEWNYDLRVPPAKINSAKINELGKVDGLRVIEAQLVLTDMYYSDVVMILQEVESGRFLPVYVQDYNRDIRWPTANVITNEEDKIIVNAGMDYAGTGHFHNHYKIIISTNQYPVVIGP
jgi:hypothetical protein